LLRRLGTGLPGAAAIAALAAAIAPALPTRQIAYTGKVLIHCTPNVSERAAVDPLESYRISPTPHLHTPAGAMAFSSTSTLAKMLAAPTSCASRADHSLIWVPTPMTAGGKPARITGFGYYLINHGHDVRRAPPEGLRFLAGDPHCTGVLCPAGYECARRDGTRFHRHTIPRRVDGCDTRGGQGYQMTVYSPGQCWDGRSFGAGMGGSRSPARITSARRCRGVVIPQIELNLEVGADGVGGYLSSDTAAGTTKSSPGSTGHFDFVFGWENQPALGRPLSAIVRRCLDVTGFTAGEVACVQMPGRGGATIYIADPSNGHPVHRGCVTGPMCTRPLPVRARRLADAGQPRIGPRIGSRP
jgi:hypothetical protein